MTRCEERGIMHAKKKRLKIKDVQGILDELKGKLRRLYGIRLLKLILYGSYARNEAWEGSDIDVAVLLAGRISPMREIDRMLDVITDINLKYNTLISIYPVSEDSLKTVKSPLLLNIEKEGVII
ncbi:MAG: nucleotidyltransferase domain-containing protein [Nitrospirota bacterium]